MRKARKKLWAASPSEHEWDNTILPAVTHLIQNTLPELSRGFGDGVLAFVATMVIFALSAFSSFLDTEQFSTLFRCFVLLCSPLVVSLDVAGASSDCDSIRVVLNSMSISSIKIEEDAKIQLLERALTLSNRGQGLGFVVAGVVVDRRTLGRIFVAVVGALGTIGPVILALKPPAVEYGSQECALTAQETLSIRAAMASSNASCAYNITVASVIHD
jgi:hypothetical protein